MPESHHHHHHHSRSMSWAFVGGEKGHLSSKLKKRFPSNLKLHYNEVCDLSEKLSRRFFSRSHGSYHVQREYRNYGKINRPSDSWVTVHNLRQLDGGILDPDDRLHDVADDREQIIAIYDEATKPQQGDGTSASDESENHSPNIFKCTDHKFEPFSRNGIDITGEELNGTPSPLHVRRGSEPALNRLSPIPPYTNVPLDPSKRWSAAPVIEDQAPSSSTPLKDQVSISSPYEDTAFEGYPGERGEGSGEEKIPSSLSASSSASSHHSATTTTLSRFSRDGNRCSVQILSDNPNMARWAEAADRVIEAGGFFGKSEGMRREPLGGSSTPRHSREHSLEDNSRPSLLVCLKNDGTPLGIHVIPSTDRSGTEQGLLVEGIEPDGRVARDGRINVHDIIIEINDKPLRNVSFHQAQEIFKAAMVDPELRLLLSRRDNNRTSPVKMIQVKEKLASGSSRIANVTQTRKTPSITLSSRTQAVMLHSNTRKIGKRLTVNLIKGPHGLGFSITTRDNPAGGEAPIYIKNILPKGAAIDEGTLRIGDRLLEVNGVQVTGYSQSEVANLLRQIAVGGVAGLVVSRQEKIEDNLSGGIDYEEDFTNANPPSPKLPRQLPSERVLPEDSLMFPWRQREILTFEIPVHDSERAGLGVSVKGKTSSGPNGSVDLGIFVKNVIHGGAASRDGRLRQNDQLVNINGLSLLGKSNSEAMKTLRTAMHQEYGMRMLAQQSSDCKRQSGEADSGLLQQEPKSMSNAHAPLPSCSQSQRLVVPTPGKITLLVARRVEGSHRELRMMGTHASDNSGTSEASDNTVIFNNKKDMDIDRSVDGCLDYGNLDSFQMNNPVIQRLTGNGNMALRNESYYKATHDTWSATQMHPPLTPLSEKERITFVGGPLEKFSSPTVNPPSRDTVLIHDEYDSNLGGRRCSGQTVVPVSSSEGVYSEQQNKSNDAYNSLTSLDESGVGFSRDQFGRQSMSEKRHATLDAKNTDTYQRNKKAREEREKYRKELYAEMGIDGENPPTTCAKGVREVPIDVPSSVVDSALPSGVGSNKLIKLSDENTGKSKPKNQFQKLNSSNKNVHSNSPTMERLKHLAKLTDLKSYTGKSLTLQPSYMQRQTESNNTQLRSLRSPSKFNTIHGENKKLGDNPLEGRSLQTKGAPNTVVNSRAKETKKGARPTAATTFGQELSAIIHSWGATRGLNKTSKEVGPGLGMRKSSSLESLQTMVQEMALEDECQRAGSGRVPRGRGCNESFRAAVDRSYDAPLSGANAQMETLTEEESESSGSGFGRGNSRQSSVSSSAEEKLKKGSKKRQGIFKGLGSMFRFGKHRKGLDHQLAEEGQMDLDNVDGHRLLSEKDDQNHQDLYKNSSDINDPLGNISGISPLDDENPSRSERMHQLRAEHQRRHVQRNGIYPTDDMEERYDHALKQVLDDMNGQQLDKANNNISNSDQLNSTRMLSDVANKVLFNQTTIVSSQNLASPLSCSVVSTNSYTSFSSNTNTSSNSSQRTKNKSNRNSLYVSCIRGPRHSPSPPNSPNDFISRNDKENILGSFLCSNGVGNDSRRHSLHIEVNHNSEVSNALVNQHLANEIRELVIHKNVPHKPPLPPRNRPFNNNYKPPLPPPNPKPEFLVSPDFDSYNPTNSGSTNLNVQDNSSLENIIGPDFVFTFSKPLPPCPDNGNFSDKRRWSIVERRSIDDVEAQNIANQTQSDLCSSIYNQQGIVAPSICNEEYQSPFWNRGTNDNQMPEPGTRLFEASNMNKGNNKHQQEAITCQPLSSNSSSGSSGGGSIRTNSLPRMGLKGKTAAKLCRSSPGPPPVPPPKGLPNILAPLRSTEVLEQSQFWRMDTMPVEPKAEIQHLRSRSYDFYGDGKDGRRQAKFPDPNKFSHYVNYEQIQMHLRKNKEQERLAKLASQQYQDFRDKQTRRGGQGEEYDKQNNLISKLEQTFIHESIVASREQREYQSQRCARETSYQQRPVSNYFEYESVQAMMNHAQSNQHTSSLSRRPQQPLPHHQQRSNQHPPPPPPTQNSSSGNSQNSFSSGANKNANNPAPKTHTQGQGRIVHPQALFSHQRGQPTPPPTGSREGVYAASGFRPASQYNTANSYLPKPLNHHSLTVPGSKV